MSARVVGEGLPKVAFDGSTAAERAGLHRCILPGRCTFGRFPTVRAGGVDLTSRFLQFGALENQCGQSYLAVPIAAASVWFRFAPRAAPAS